MQLAYSKKAANTPAFALIAEGWNEMVQEGLTPDGVAVCPVKADDEVLYVVSSDGDIVGVVVYGVDDDSSSFVVKLAYVEPSMRKRGVFKSLVIALKRYAVERGVLHVGLQAPANSQVEAVMRHLNSPIASVVYELAEAAQGV